ncbi:hypothetical protein GF373_07490 [bacterium]|nr:hypothetical protein [bacterium]
MNNPPLPIWLRAFFSWPAVIGVALFAFIFADCIPWAADAALLVLITICFLECFLFLQLIFAWYYAASGGKGFQIYVLVALLLFRLGFRLYEPGAGMWVYQAAGVMDWELAFLWYALGVCMIHPSGYRLVFERLRIPPPSNRFTQVAIGAGMLVFCAWLFWVYRSAYITRDGFDWIQRAVEPVWHLYMREPLTIGLHRAAFLLGWHGFGVTSASMIAILSIAAGLWSLVWFYRFTTHKLYNFQAQGLAWLLLIASGGFSILLFGHIEVYPLLVAGLVPVFYYASRYLEEKNGIVIVAIAYAIAFLLHLSAAWLLPAMLVLPWIKQKPAWKEIGKFAAVFGGVQLVFWGWLLIAYYHADLPAMLARLHETFFVGPDQAMFLPYFAVVHPAHFADLLNDLLYITAPGMILLPFTLWYVRWHAKRDDLFWGLAAGGYFLYILLWNPDRGFPEDWDLFSPFALILTMFHINVLLGNRGAEEPSAEENPKRSGLPAHGALLYTAAMGVLPYILIQIRFHHISNFIPPHLF